MCYELSNWTSLTYSIIIIGVEETDEDPLRPPVVFGIGGAHLTRPVEAKAYTIELLSVASDVFFGCDLWVLPSLYGILFCRKSKGIIAHRMEDIEATKSLIAREYIGGNVAQRMPYMQACT